MAEKSVGIAINDLKRSIANAVNESHLHPSITKMVLHELYDELRLTEEQVVTQETNQYAKQVAEEKVQSKDTDANEDEE